MLVFRFLAARKWNDNRKNSHEENNKKRIRLFFFEHCAILLFRFTFLAFLRLVHSSRWFNGIYSNFYAVTQFVSSSLLSPSYIDFLSLSRSLRLTHTDSRALLNYIKLRCVIAEDNAKLRSFFSSYEVCPTKSMISFKLIKFFNVFILWAQHERTPRSTSDIIRLQTMNMMTF